MQGCVLSIVPRGYLPELAGGLEICAMETIEFFIEQGYSGAVAAKCPQTFRGKLAARLSRKFIEARECTVKTGKWRGVFQRGN